MTQTSLSPRLRWPLDIQMHQTGSEHILVIRCPIGISEKPLLLAGGVAPLLNTFTGEKSIEQIEYEFAQFGVTRSLIDELVTLLDDHLFLANDRFVLAQDKVRADFINAAVRPAALAGLSYSNDPWQLARDIDAYLQSPAPVKPAPRGSLALLVSPHIDYRRGGSCYGRAYRETGAENPDLYILAGTAHQYSSLLFHLTRKDFVSPLGPLVCDQPFVDTLAHRYGYARSYADELLHRREHSLELQLPFLSRVKPGSSIVPILVGSFHTMVNAQRSPEEYSEYDDFAGALTETISDALKEGRKVTFIAGVDMAHVGQHFGDREKLSPEFMQQIETRDHEYLRALTTQNKRALFEHIAEDGDARRICGFPTMYTILDVMGRLGWRPEASVFDYQQAVDYGSDCAVTFAALGFYHQTTTNNQ